MPLSAPGKKGAMKLNSLHCRRILGASARLDGPISARHIAGVRRLLGGFIREVHPDLAAGSFPPLAVRMNQQSLAELNAFIDRLEADTPPRLEDGPEAARELPFFRSYITRSGRLLPGRVMPLRLPLPALPVEASFLQLEYAAARLIRDAELILETSATGFSDQPEVAPLLTQKGASRQAFDKLWYQQTQDEILREALRAPSDAEVRRHAAKKVFAQKYEYQLVRRYARIKNKRRRRDKLESVPGKVELKLQLRFPAEPAGQWDEEEAEIAGERDALRVIENAFHPDLVFVVPGLSIEHRREAIRRVCGMNLASDADFWLLENLWKAMRAPPTPVPLVVAAEGYKAHLEVGFIQVPWDFTVAQLCDLLEEHLDAARAALAHRRQSWVDLPPVSGEGSRKLDRLQLEASALPDLAAWGDDDSGAEYSSSEGEE